MLEIRLLGQFHIRQNEALVEIPTRPAKKLLAYLALKEGLQQQRDKLAGLLWPDSDELSARRNLRSTLWRLRKAMGDTCFLSDKTSITFVAPDAGWVDTAVLQEKSRETEGLLTAVSAYSGELLPGWYDDWIILERERLQAIYERKLQQLLDQLLAAQQWDETIHWAEQWISLGSVPEPAYRGLMHAHAGLGDVAAIAAAFRRCEAALEADLGVEPSAETQTLYETLKRNPAAVVPATKIIPPHAKLVTAVKPTAPFTNFIESEQPIRFVAREKELNQLERALAQSLTGRGNVLFVKGSAGSGKSALMMQFARQAQEANEGVMVAMGNCNAHTGIGDPYLPFRDILKFLTGDVEGKWAAEPNSPAQANHDVNQQQAALFAQYTQIMLSHSQQGLLILLLDDLQWADSSSINLLFHLGRRIQAGRILLVCAYREDEVMLGQSQIHQNGRHPLSRVVNELQRIYGGGAISLDTESVVEGQAFVKAYLDSEPNDFGTDFYRALHHHTNGHPLFTVELLRHLQDMGEVVLDGNGRWQTRETINWNTLPARVEAVIEERIDRLAADLREMLTVASVEGAEFTAQVIAQIQEMEEHGLVRQLSRELDKKHRLVGEQGHFEIGGRRLFLFHFRHNLYQQHLYNGLGEIERSLLHEDVGLALEALYGERRDEIAPQLAWHFAEAGEAEKAIYYSLLAGDQARGLYAHQEAINHYQRALPFLRKRDENERLARTLMKLGLTYHNAFDFQQSRRAYEEGFAYWQRIGGKQTALDVAPHPLRLLVMEPLTLDSGQYDDDASAQIVYNLFSGLVELSPEMSVVPDMAQSWQVLENGRRYIFKLRNDLFWSDGVRVTAVDFEYAWKRMLHPSSGERPGNYLYDIQNARAYHQGEINDPNEVGVTAEDELTLTVTLDKPTSYFPQLLTAGNTFPVPKHIVERFGDAWTEPENLVTNGAFRLVEWQRGKSILERNPTYHGRFSGNLERVELSFFSGEDDVGKKYADDLLDTLNLNFLPAPEQERARQTYAGEYVTGPLLSTTYVGFNLSQPPFDDVRVRRALTLATDLGSLAGIVLKGYVFSATGGLVPPGMPGHSRGSGLPYDPEAARVLLAEAGFPDGKGFPEVTAVITDDPSPIQLGQYLQAQWLTNLGINIQWQPLSWGKVVKYWSGGIANIWIKGWSADYPDPDNFLRFSDFQNDANWQRLTFNQLVEKGLRVTEQKERLSLYTQADQILVDEAVILPLLYKRFHLLLKPWVHQFPTSSMLRNFWKDVVIKSSSYPL
ncbi:MAG: AAA family ATPase [bacterium]|nr:AAA family ATPase [bacterium]